MKQFTKILIIGVISACVAGCAKTRSISNSAYANSNMLSYAYRGELSEFDLLGIDRNQFVTEEQIVSTLDAAKSIQLRRDETVLLIQSGAAFPDSEMANAMGAHFRVVPFSGIPPREMDGGGSQERDRPAFNRSFRMAAAQAGAEHIVCYWGALESMRENMETKVVSWVPVLGWMIPDENQAMRIKVKMAVIDVRTGAWSVFSPDSVVDISGRSNRFNRGKKDQKQVVELKAKAYSKGVEGLLAAYQEHIH